MAASAKTKAKVKAMPGATASVQALVSEASRSVEAAAILRAVWAAIGPRFHAGGGRLPELLLRRRGSGARPAEVESIVEAEIAIETLARELDARAQTLLALRVDVGERSVQSPSDDFMSDEVVERKTLEAELRIANSSSPSPQS